MSGPILPGGGRRELREPESQERRGDRDARSFSRRAVGGVSQDLADQKFEFEQEFESVRADIVVVGDDVDQAQMDANQALADAAAADLEAARANGSLDDWAYDTDRTYINGGYLQTGTVVAAAIHAAGITADKVTVGADSTFETNYDPSAAKAAADAAQSTADSASASAAGANDTLDLWAYDGSRTEIKGGNLRAGSVTAQALAALTFVSGLYMESSNFDGTFNTDGTINGTGTTGWAVDWAGQAVYNGVIVRGTLDGVSGTFTSLEARGDFGEGVDLSDNGVVLSTASDGNQSRMFGGRFSLRNSSGTERAYWARNSFDEVTFYSASDLIINSGSGNISVSGDVSVTGLMVASNNVRPSTGQDGNLNLGTSVARWKSVWAVDTTINSSDASTKSTIEDSALGLDFVRQIRPVSFVREGRKRPHYGFVAQQVKQVIDRLGVDFAGYVDPQVGEPDAVQENGAPPFLGLRYSEFIAPLMSAVQELADDRDALRARVDDLEARMEALEAS